MTILRASISSRPFEYTTGIYTTTPESDTLESFSKKKVSIAMRIYSILNLDLEIKEYTTTPTAEIESMYGEELRKYFLHQPASKSEAMRESLSTLKPEIVGLSLGSIISFGVGVFALVTSNPGLATVMAGPFLASILGFSLLWIGLRRKK